jgi:hypothetical protein
LIEKLAADTLIDSVSTGRRPINGISNKICRIIGHIVYGSSRILIVRQQQQDRSIASSAAAATNR